MDWGDDAAVRITSFSCIRSVLSSQQSPSEVAVPEDAMHPFSFHGHYILLHILLHILHTLTYYYILLHIEFVKILKNT